MNAGYYDVQIIYKAGFETRVYAQNEDDAKRRAIAELEMGGDYLEALGVSARLSGSQTTQEK